jgi:hypothetical protein
LRGMTSRNFARIGVPGCEADRETDRSSDIPDPDPVDAEPSRASGVLVVLAAAEIR